MSIKKTTLLQRFAAVDKVIWRDIHALWLAARDPRTPWHAKLLALLVAAYTVSPLDLIPGFIPVIGYLDDLIGTARRVAGGPSDS